MKFVHFLIAIPLLGNLVEWGVFLVSLVLGIFISIATIVTSMVFHSPWTAIFTVLAVAALVFFLLTWKNRAKANAQKNLQAQEVSHELGTDRTDLNPPVMDLTERIRKVFCNLVKKAMVDGTLDKN